MSLIIPGLFGGAEAQNRLFVKLYRNYDFSVPFNQAVLATDFMIWKFLLMGYGHTNPETQVTLTIHGTSTLRTWHRAE